MKKKYKIKKTKALVRKLRKYMNEYSEIESEFYQSKGELEKKMERETGIRGIEFFFCDGEMSGIGNDERTMELIHRIELEEAKDE